MSRSLDDVNNEEWLIEMGTVMGEKELVLERYTNYPEEKVAAIHLIIHVITLYILQGFLFKCVGVIMRKATQRQFVQKLLDAMFATIKHSNQVEREVYTLMWTCREREREHALKNYATSQRRTDTYIVIPVLYYVPKNNWVVLNNILASTDHLLFY